nr:hypothetical protein [uncultured Draconibacterium sp.]
MKKKSEALGILHPFAKKMMLVMRLTIFLILVSVLASTASINKKSTQPAGKMLFR